MNEDYIFEEGEEVYQPIGMAVASLVLGLLSLVFFLVGLNLVGAIISIILGIIFIATRRGQAGKRLAVIGIITSIISIVLFFGSMSYMLSNSKGILALEKDILSLYDANGLYQAAPDDLLEELDSDDFL
jgi:ABC-type Fe3+-siderophore transport system permease subunit